MKVVSKEEEAAHYSQVVRGGLIGGSIGLAGGVAAVILASRRYQVVRNLTLPFRAFLVTSAGTFGAITTAENYSISFQRSQDPNFFYKDESERLLAEAAKNQSTTKRLMEWGRQHRYQIVLGSWLAGMTVALGLLGRNRYMTTSQKLVQARVYAQGLTLGMILATAAFETSDAQSGKGHWETIMVVDPDDPEHKHLIEKKVHKEEYQGQDLWKDMVVTEERRLAEVKRRNEAAAAPKQQS